MNDHELKIKLNLQRTIYNYGGPPCADCCLCSRQDDPGCKEDDAKTLCVGFKAKRRIDMWK